MEGKGIIVGIDLGTTNSVVSILEKGIPKTIEIDEQLLLPSVVSLMNGDFIVGREARNIQILEPENTISSIKRKMGQDVKITIGDKELRPEEISALILKKIKQAVQSYKGVSETIEIRGVITVPAYFTEEQRKATKQAAELAGIKVERIINEPTAAALAFGMSSLDETTYAVYDFGGGTFDVSVIESDEGLVEVLASGGNNQLGGDDLDEILANYIWETFKAKENLENEEMTAKEKSRLTRIAETAKIKLSSENEVAVNESFFYKKDATYYHLELKITRVKFEELITAKIDETIEHLKETILESKIDNDDLTGVLLVGGSARIPLISSKIKLALGTEPKLIENPDEAVSYGATVQGAIIDGIDLKTILVDITPHSLGTEVMDDEWKYMQAAITHKEEHPEEKFDINPYLNMSVIIAKNTPVPAKKTKRYYSMNFFQEKYRIEVLQGEEEAFLDNKLIGSALLEIEKPAESGEIEVTFELDINGILNVHAIEINTKEFIEAQFKSAKGEWVTKPDASITASVIAETTSILIERSEKLLKSETIAEEDSEDLRELLEKLKSQKEANDYLAVDDTEQELLDLLFYLENEESSNEG